MMNDLLTYEAIRDDKHKEGRTIAWVIGIVLAFVVLAIVWSTMHRTQAEANRDAISFAANTQERVGILEGNQVAVGTILNTTTQNVSSLLQTAAANATNVAAQGKVLDEAIEVRARGSYPTYGVGVAGGCGANAIASAVNPKFRQVNEYAQCNSRLFEESTCGNASF